MSKQITVIATWEVEEMTDADWALLAAVEKFFPSEKGRNFQVTFGDVLYSTNPDDHQATSDDSGFGPPPGARFPWPRLVFAGTNRYGNANFRVKPQGGEKAETSRQQPAPAGTPYVEPRTGPSEGTEPDLGLKVVGQPGTNASTTRSS